MAWVKVIHEDEAQGELRQSYDRVRAQRGKVANVVKISGLLPQVMEKGIEFYLALMFGPHKLPRREREMVAVEVSRANACEYCVNHHGAALARVVRDDAFAKQFMASGAQAVTTDRERVMLDYTRKLTRTPERVTRADVEALRRVGFDDEEIVAINHIVGYFAMMNRFVMGLGVELEDDKGAAAEYKY